MIKVLLVDDHEMVRMGLSAYLSTEEDIEVVGEASNGKEGVALALQLQPDVILMDLVMEVMDGIEATKQITSQLPAVKVIVLTSFVDDEKVYPVIEAGAFSYLLKTTRAPEIAQAIRAAFEGESVVESQVTNKMMQRMRTQQKKLLHEELTPRELDVLKLIGIGKTNQEIADELYIGIKTVKTHVSNILAKLNVDDRTQIAIYAHRHGLVN
ncbi:response regulator transcription factor [Alkalihalobacterium chitinilyticum]|uniref:Response regulator transcription factor n=1 Tax=Alkalihalobacterium chitinilyticum TaxID=2980103 RepID=A0ABT5VIJ0_9BACI|nr:response regulator transcription factor [Alkalihalobacterium chitinilyticum]MDE5414991.1 response regulator transcription factor [Alkalihalobacterium chitinilyticum]